MNYQLIYNNIVLRGQIREREVDVYYEYHHIIPRCMNGNDEKLNLVYLTAREHFLCHWLLVRIYPENKKLIFAFYAMCNIENRKTQKRYKPSSRIYKEVKEKLSLTDEHKKKIGDANSKKRRTEEQKEHLRKINTGKIVLPHSQETRDKIGNGNRNKIRSDEIKKQWSLSHQGKIRSSEASKACSESHKNKPKVYCLHCRQPFTNSSINNHLKSLK